MYLFPFIHFAIKVRQQLHIHPLSPSLIQTRNIFPLSGVWLSAGGLSGYLGTGGVRSAWPGGSLKAVNTTLNPADPGTNSQHHSECVDEVLGKFPPLTSVIILCIVLLTTEAEAGSRHSETQPELYWTVSFQHHQHSQWASRPLPVPSSVGLLQMSWYRNWRLFYRIQPIRSEFHCHLHIYTVILFHISQSTKGKDTWWVYKLVYPLLCPSGSNVQTITPVWFCESWVFPQISSWYKRLCFTCYLMWRVTEQFTTARLKLLNSLEQGSDVSMSYTRVCPVLSFQEKSSDIVKEFSFSFLLRPVETVMQHQRWGLRVQIPASLWVASCLAKCRKRQSGCWSEPAEGWFIWSYMLGIHFRGCLGFSWDKSNAPPVVWTWSHI